jgi:hypothetical protein
MLDIALGMITWTLIASVYINTTKTISPWYMWILLGPTIAISLILVGLYRLVDNHSGAIAQLVLVGGVASGSWIIFYV